MASGWNGQQLLPSGITIEPPQIVTSCVRARVYMLCRADVFKHVQKLELPQPVFLPLGNLLYKQRIAHRRTALAAV